MLMVMLSNVSKHPFRTVFIIKQVWWTERVWAKHSRTCTTRSMLWHLQVLHYQLHLHPSWWGIFFPLHCPVNLSFSVQACNYRLLPEISVTCHGGYSYLKCGKQFYSKFVLIVTLDHKTSLVLHGYICSKSQKYIDFWPIIYFIPNRIKI